MIVEQRHATQPCQHQHAYTRAFPPPSSLVDFSRPLPCWSSCSNCFESGCLCAGRRLLDVLSISCNAHRQFALFYLSQTSWCITSVDHNSMICCCQVQANSLQPRRAAACQQTQLLSMVTLPAQLHNHMRAQSSRNSVCAPERTRTRRLLPHDPAQLAHMHCRHTLTSEAAQL